MTRTAVVLFNLGGPDSLEAVRPFLFNLFNDAAIIGLPQPFRWMVARFISRRRAPVARQIYGQLGDKSPLLEQTEAQATALENELAGLGELKVFVCMRYWHPMSGQTAAAVAEYGPDRIVALPLYPQFSTTTTASSLADWRGASAVAGLTAPLRAICCYPLNAGWIEAQADLIGGALRKAAAYGQPRILFSAHGLPERIVARGDPYPSQVERTAAAVIDRLAAIGIAWPAADWSVCYQSRVGRLKWTGPSIEEELGRAGGDGVPVVVVPISFVSEHSETLVELDKEYRELAKSLHVPGYVRVAAVGVHRAFIRGLAGLVRDAIGRDRALTSDGAGGTRECPASAGRCPLPESA